MWLNSRAYATMSAVFVNYDFEGATSVKIEKPIIKGAFAAQGHSWAACERGLPAPTAAAGWLWVAASSFGVGMGAEVFVGTACALRSFVAAATAAAIVVGIGCRGCRRCLRGRWCRSWRHGWLRWGAWTWWCCGLGGLRCAGRGCPCSLPRFRRGWSLKFLRHGSMAPRIVHLDSRKLSHPCPSPECCFPSSCLLGHYRRLLVRS